MTSPHRLINPDSLPFPVGFSHAVVATSGSSIYLGGQTAHGADGQIQGTTICEQFEAATANLVQALAAAGARPEHLVSLLIFVTNVAEYRASLAELGSIYQRHLGRHYPAVSLFEVRALFDPAAKLELVAQAVVPD
jgi:enamine deaminase RidA (YjgF/YER057c/UK114 family)